MERPRTRTSSSEFVASCCELPLLRVVGLALSVADRFLYACRYAVGLQIAKRRREIPSNSVDRKVDCQRVALAFHHRKPWTAWLFKYANFFIENWIEAWSAVGVAMDPWSLKVILPVGVASTRFKPFPTPLTFTDKLNPRNLLEFAALSAFLNS